MGVQIKNLDRLLKKLNKIDEGLKAQILEKAVEAGAKRVQREAKKLCPVNNGELRNSIKTTTENENGKLIGKVYTNKEYAGYVEFGTGPKGEEAVKVLPAEIESKLVYHQEGWYIPGNAIEEAVAKRYHLKAYKDSNGEVKYYYTEGQAPQPFLYPALSLNQDKVQQTVVNSINKQLAQITGGE